MLSRPQLELINRKSLKYPLQVAEKDYMLALTLELITHSSLGDKLVFKGGTAIHHCYLEQYRFSEDLDFSSVQNPISIEEVQGVLTDLDYLEIKKYFESKATIKIERLLFTGPLGHPNSIKVEIDFYQKVLLPVQSLPYRTVWGLEFPVNVMDIREICAEKIRAMSDRARFRDFYDYFMILDSYDLDLEEITTYIKKKEIRKPITKKNIIKNWGITGDQKDDEKSIIFYSHVINDQQVLERIQKLPFEEIV